MILLSVNYRAFIEVSSESTAACRGVGVGGRGGEALIYHLYLHPGCSPKMNQDYDTR